jgi:endonuclease III
MKETAEQKRARVKRVISVLKEIHPDAKLALDFENPLQLLIALILAAQARDDLVNSVTADLFKRYRTAQEWLEANPDTLHQALGKINFYRNKTKSIQNACRMLIDEFGGKVPNRLDDLLKLPGVGRKTANVLLGNAFGEQAIGVDTHVSRLSQRLGFSRNVEPDEIETDLTQIVPRPEWVKFCHLLQFHGRRVCKAKKPECPRCAVNSLCPYPHKTKSSNGDG